MTNGHATANVFAFPSAPQGVGAGRLATAAAHMESTQARLRQEVAGLQQSVTKMTEDCRTVEASIGAVTEALRQFDPAAILRSARLSDRLAA